MDLDTASNLFSIVLASLLVAAMASKRAFRSSPAFFAYVGFDLVTGAVGLAIYLRSGISYWYWGCLAFEVAGDFLLYFWVLLETARSLLRFNRENLPQTQIAAWFFAGTAVLIFTLSRWTVVPDRSFFSNAYVLGMRATSVLQFAGFLALILWSSLRKLRWPERELHIATGLGVNVFAWFLVALLHARWTGGPAYHWLDQGGQAVQLIALAYWLHFFLISAPREDRARKSAEERNSQRSRDKSEMISRCDLAGGELPRKSSFGVRRSLAGEEAGSPQRLKDAIRRPRVAV
ncbi:MAG: hypothetical protein ACP5E2_09175 [Terracidiphilus sp.]